MNLQTVRRGFAMVAVLAVAGTTGLAVASSAAAGYGGVQPESTICFKDRLLVRQAPLVKGRLALGTVQLWYSPKCRTTWARIDTSKASGNGYSPTVSVIRNKDQVANSCWVRSGAKSCTTTMMNDANVTSYAIGYIFSWYPQADHNTYARTGSY